ncbi:MAG TPA: hypothetical protein VK447_08155 [Myxococcaceae bacterium]|nr:hypothetical protein [Myxococcaceae bacterium]
MAPFQGVIFEGQRLLITSELTVPVTATVTVPATGQPTTALLGGSSSSVTIYPGTGTGTGSSNLFTIPRSGSKPGASAAQNYALWVGGGSQIVQINTFQISGALSSYTPKLQVPLLPNAMVYFAQVEYWSALPLTLGVYDTSLPFAGSSTNPSLFGVGAFTVPAASSGGLPTYVPLQVQPGAAGKHYYLGQPQSSGTSGAAMQSSGSDGAEVRKRRHGNAEAMGGDVIVINVGTSSGKDGTD